MMKETIVVDGKFNVRPKIGPRLVTNDRTPIAMVKSATSKGARDKAAIVETPKSGLIDQAAPPKAFSSDFTLGAVGCGLAVASVSFGVYMNVHGPAPHEPGKDFSVFAQFAPRAVPPPRSVVAQREGEPLDMTATASIPHRDPARTIPGFVQDIPAPARDVTASAMRVEAADNNAATIMVDGQSLKVHVGDTIPGAGEVLAIYPGLHPLVKTSRGTILATRQD